MDKTAVSSTLVSSFGVHRELPVVLEAAIYSFLPLVDAANHFWTSKATSASVASYLKHTKQVPLDHALFQPEAFGDSSFALGLSLRLCRNVQRISVFGEWNTSRPFVALRLHWLHNLIENNRLSLRALHSWGCQNMDIVEQLLQCPNLERFAAFSTENDKYLRPSAVAMLQYDHLPCCDTCACTQTPASGPR